MGLLDHLWDDTVAGPRPDSGISKLRKHDTFGFRSNAGKGSDVGTCGDDSTQDMVIAKPTGYQNRSPPVSPVGSTPPFSPFSGSRIRRSSSNAYKKPSTEGRKNPSSAYDV